MLQSLPCRPCGAACNSAACNSAPACNSAAGRDVGYSDLGRDSCDATLGSVTGLAGRRWGSAVRNLLLGELEHSPDHVPSDIAVRTGGKVTQISLVVLNPEFVCCLELDLLETLPSLGEQQSIPASSATRHISHLLVFVPFVFCSCDSLLCSHFLVCRKRLLYCDFGNLCLGTRGG